MQSVGLGGLEQWLLAFTPDFHSIRTPMMPGAHLHDMLLCPPPATDYHLPEQTQESQQMQGSMRPMDDNL